MRALAAVTAVTLLALWLAAPRPVDLVSFSVGAIVAGVAIAVGLAAAGRFGPLVVWTAIAISSLAFGLVHLPAWLAVAQPTPLLAGFVLALNGVGGIALGWVYWGWALEAAIVCHFAADIAGS